MSRFEQVEILLAGDSALDVELTARALGSGGLARVQNCDMGVDSYGVQPVDFNALAGLARQAGYCWLAIDRTPTP